MAVDKSIEEQVERIEAHHIESFMSLIIKNNIKTYEEGLACEELWNIDNGITLCSTCHKKYTWGDEEDDSC